MKFKRLRIAQTVFKKKNRVGGLKLPDFKTYYKATVNKIVYYLYQDEQIDQCNRI